MNDLGSRIPDRGPSYPQVSIVDKNSLADKVESGLEWSEEELKRRMASFHIVIGLRQSNTFLSVDARGEAWIFKNL